VPSEKARFNALKATIELPEISLLSIPVDLEFGNADAFNRIRMRVKIVS